jgi:hypothetical protein
MEIIASKLSQRNYLSALIQDYSDPPDPGHVWQSNESCEKPSLPPQKQNVERPKTEKDS